MVIYYNAPGAVNPLAPTGTAVPLDGAFIEHGEASRSDPWRKRRGCAVRGTGAGLPGFVSSQPSSAARSEAGRSGPRSAQRRWSDQPPRDHDRRLTGDAAPVVLSAAGRRGPVVTIAVR